MFEYHKIKFGGMAELRKVLATDVNEAETKMILLCVTRDGKKLTLEELNEIDYEIIKHEILPEVMRVNKRAIEDTEEKK
jgi:hypothetical protein